MHKQGCDLGKSSLAYCAQSSRKLIKHLPFNVPSGEVLELEPDGPIVVHVFASLSVLFVGGSFQECALRINDYHTVVGRNGATFAPECCSFGKANFRLVCQRKKHWKTVAVVKKRQGFCLEVRPFFSSLWKTTKGHPSWKSWRKSVRHSQAQTQWNDLARLRWYHEHESSMLGKDLGQLGYQACGKRPSFGGSSINWCQLDLFGLSRLSFEVFATLTLTLDEFLLRTKHQAGI